jgi:hypothetical protein
MVRSALIASLAFVSVLPLQGAEDLPETKTQSLEFAPGGSLRIRLGTGDLRIVKGTDNRHINLRYVPKSKHKDFASQVRLRFEVHGPEAEIEFKAPHGGEIDTEVEVPSPTNLEVRLSVGDIRVEGIDGNKDVQVHVGDLKVDLGPQSTYWKAEASTHIGDIDGQPSWGQPKGWLGHSLRFQGDGQYRLRVHAGIGDINLSSQPAEPGDFDPNLI